MAASSNFSFLEERFPVLAKFGEQAERYYESDPNSCLMKVGMFGETVVKLIFDTDCIEHPVPDDAVHRIRRLQREDYITDDLADILHALRKARNLAVHEGYDSPQEARALLPLAHSLGEWFFETYGDYRYEHHIFVYPLAPQPGAQAAPPADAEADEALLADATATAKPTAAPAAERKQQARRAALSRHRSEAETRRSIDEALRRVGWEVDTNLLNRKCNKTMPQRGHNMAIAEWPTGDSAAHPSGYADYALFLGEKLVGIIEAKAEAKDVYAVLDGQGRDYPSAILDEDRRYTLGEWQIGTRTYRVPFTFATNGRPYFAQYEEKSGIWFQDLRDAYSQPRALRGWISPDGISDMLRTDKAAREASAARLQASPYEDLQDPQGLALRDYQVAAIRAVEAAVARGQERILLAMATGTGKTRTVLGLIYRFLKADRFRRILFLVDRTVLGGQAQDTFGEVHLDELKPLSALYNIQGLDDAADLARETRVQIATVQSMVRRILYHEGDRVPAVTDFDLVIIDEAHRGYLLDKEMSDEEMLYRDERDYLSKYKSIVDYFTGTKIALTATPALHTTQIFGDPVYTYSYREAVFDGYLVDHDAPIEIETRLSREGIHYEKGAEVSLFDPESSEVIDGARLPDKLDFDVADFNRKVITEGFNRAVVTYLAAQIDPADRQEGKTLIFAVSDAHADMLVRLLREAYQGTVPADAIQKITGSIENGNQKKIRAAVQRFKNEQYPSIVVTVDLLTTGVDVPEITNLVFLRRVQSRILFEQMLGRATRLCRAIHKDVFHIYDAVGAYAAMERFTAMRPVVTQPKDDFTRLLDGLAELMEQTHEEKGEGNGEAPDEATSEERQGERRAQSEVLTAIRARLQRKDKLLTDAQKEDWEAALPEGLQGAIQTPAALAARLGHLPADEAAQTAIACRSALIALDRVRRAKGSIVIDKTPDEVTAAAPRYDGKNAEDYLEAFTAYVRDNRDKIEAMHLILTSPSSLTCRALKDLRRALSAQNFTERSLSDAVSRVTKQTITADIISLVRRATMAEEPLISHEQRIERATARLKRELRAQGTLTKQQENLLDKLAQYFRSDANYVIDRAAFDDARLKQQGGYSRFDKIFGGALDAVLERFNRYLYEQGEQTA